uniref:Uncharacterized protein n=1 Tax=Cryptomonas curvata TaxID=233186 RepID=A0A7S0QYR2_9CRYP|mmetsp:Transcript_59995/g.125497  ORF Transcript_59995/g.125497 Transcript_59995/m.125497 type:complete len:412 (+) Transcript_59995:1043-2278(+)
MASKPVFQIVFIAVSVFTAYSCGVAIGALIQEGSFASNQVRLDILNMLDRNAHSQHNDWISEFGLLLDGCIVANTSIKTNKTWTVYQNAEFKEFSFSRINGYYFKITDNASNPADPFTWRVEASADNGSSWVIAGASVWRLDSSGTPEFFPQLWNDPRSGNRNTDSHDSIIFRGDMRPPISWILNTIGEYAVYATGFAAFSSAALTGRVGYVKGIWVSMLVIDALLYSASCAVILRTEKWLWREAIEIWMDIVAQLLLAFCTLVDEARCILVLLIYCGVNTVSNTVVEVILYERDVLDVLYGRLYTMSGIGFLFGVGVMLFRQRVLVRAQALVLADKRKYDMIWNQIMANSDTRAAILNLHNVATSLVCRDWPTKLHAIMIFCSFYSPFDLAMILAPNMQALSPRSFPSSR